MPVLAVVAVVLAAACGTYLIAITVRRLRTPRDLRGDWWCKFEHEFRAYAARTATANRQRRRGHHRDKPA